MRIRDEADAGTRTPDPLLTMEVLYQLSYVGANPNPTVVAADLDMIPARNDHKCPVGSGGVFVAVPGMFQGQNAREASPAQSRRALRTQPGRDLTDTEAPMPIHGKEGVRPERPAPSTHRKASSRTGF
jgi:hypothetical protein